MARTGRFGRAPRTAPSLTNTIIAIAREFQAQRDQNIMDAWQKGGTFEGKKVTDALVLQHWREKVNGVSKDDPLHDTYQNTVTQLDYTIHESKMTADYAQHKKSDAQMVAFYLGWAKKVPKDSEFYRVLQRDAGQYMRRSRASGVESARRAEELAYQKSQAATRQHYEAAGEYIIDTLRRVAQSGYAKGGVGPLISAPGSNSDLTDFDPSDPEQMLNLLGIIDPAARKFRALPNGSTESAVAGGGNPDVIFHNDDKVGITGKAIMDQLAKLDPNFKPGATLDVGYITGLLDQQNKGLQERIDRATKTGHASDAAELQKSKAYVATLNREVGAWPIEKAYRDLRDTFDQVANDPTASPQAVLKAHQVYTAALSGLANDKRIAADDNLRARLMAEAQGKDGVPTLNESFTGLQNGAFDPTSAKDSANTAAHMKFLQDQIDTVQSGKALWTYGTTGKDGIFVPDPSGKEIGAATYQDITAHGAPGSDTSIVVIDPRGGNPLTMAVTAVPVYATAKMPDGTPVHPENSNPVAFAYDIPNGGKTTTIYGFKGKDGSTVYSAEPPWDDRLRTSSSSNGGNHIEVDMSPLIPTVPGANPNTPALGLDLSKDVDPSTPGIQTADGKTLTGWHVQGAGAPSTQNPNGTPGTLTFDPYAALTSTSDRNALGEFDPQTDFHSLTLATLVNTPGGHDILRDIDRNPMFKAQLDADNYHYAGYDRDPSTGAWMPGAKTDPNKLNSVINQQNILGSSNSILDFFSKVGAGMQRQVTGSPFLNGTNDPHPGKSQDDMLTTSQNKLATDLVQNTPFAALGAAFQPGTSTLKQPDMEQMRGMVIKQAEAIKTPTVPAAKPITVQGPNAQPTAYQPPPTQTGSQPPPSQTGSQPPGGSTYDITKDYHAGAR